MTYKDRYNAQMSTIARRAVQQSYFYREKNSSARANFLFFAQGNLEVPKKSLKNCLKKNCTREQTCKNRPVKKNCPENKNKILSEKISKVPEKKTINTAKTTKHRYFGGRKFSNRYIILFPFTI